MKCWNSAFNAQGSESNYSNCTGKSSENICDRERQDETQFTTKTKLFRFVRFSFPVTHFMAYYAETGKSSENICDKERQDET
jgi:hypothetical protein